MAGTDGRGEEEREKKRQGLCALEIESREREVGARERERREEAERGERSSSRTPPTSVHGATHSLARPPSLFSARSRC